MRRQYSRYRESKDQFDSEALITYHRYFTMKMVAMQFLLPTVIITIAVMVSLEAFTQNGKFNSLGFTVGKSALLDGTLEKVTTTAEFYQWLREASEEVRLQRETTRKDGCCRLPIGAIVVRQFRVKPAACPSSEFRRVLGKTHPDLQINCRPEFSNDNADLQSIAPQGTVTAASQSAWSGTDFYPLDGNDVIGELATYTKGYHNSMVLLPVQEGNASMVTYYPPSQIIDELEAGVWIGKYTSAISVGLYMFHLEYGTYLSSTAVVEIDAGGQFLPWVRGSHLRLRRISTTMEIVRFAVDVFLTLCCLYQLFEILYGIAIGKELCGNWFDAIVDARIFVQFGSCALLSTSLALRFAAIAQTRSSFSESSSRSQFEELQSLHDLYRSEETQGTLTAWMVFFVMLRLVMNFRYCTRLSLVSETLISGLHDFVGIGSLSMLVLFAYALTGHILWYQTDTGFKTLGGSILMLFNIMISLEINDYEVFFKYNPYSTALFFVTFFIVAWCVLLNVTVGVLATSFAAALETQTFIRRPDWALPILARDFLRLLARFAFDDGSYSDYVPQSENYNPLLRCMMPVTRKVILHAVDVTQFLRDAPATVTASTLEDNTSYKLSKIRHIGQKSILHVGLHDAKLRQWKMLQKSVEGGQDITTQLSTQFRRLEEIHEKICGAMGLRGEAEDDGVGAEDHAQAEVKRKHEDLLERIRAEAQDSFHIIDRLSDMGHTRREGMRRIGERLERMCASLDKLVESLS